MSSMFGIRQLTITALTLFLPEAEAEAQHVQGPGGSSLRITIPPKSKYRESNTQHHRVKGTGYVQVTLPQSAWPCLGKAHG